MTMDQFSTYDLVSRFNCSEFRRKSIPQQLFSGWPCIQMVGKTLCLTIPYYARTATSDKIALYPIYCSVTFPILNPERLMDFTIYPHQRTWSDLDYSQPVGYFKHEALKDITTKSEYQALCRELFGYYDQMIQAVLDKRPFEQEEEMIRCLSKLMEPGQYPQYLRINKRFYSHFCRL